MNYREIKPEDITGAEIDYAIVNQVHDGTGGEPREDRTTGHIRMGFADLKIWLAFQILEKISWRRLVEVAVDPDLVTRDFQAAQRTTDQALGALIKNGLVDPNRVQRDGLDPGPYVQRALQETAEEREALEIARKEEAADLQRRLRQIKRLQREKDKAPAEEEADPVVG